MRIVSLVLDGVIHGLAMVGLYHIALWAIDKIV